MPELLDGTGEALAAAEPAADASRPSNGGADRGFAATARHWLRSHVVVLVGVPVATITLFLLYLHQARFTPLNADGSSNALQAWDMLHGNVLLSNWSLSDVSFYFTELPEYMLVEAVHGLNGDVVHVAAALSYTLAVLLACWLGRGAARGVEAFVRILIVLVVMLAPGHGSGSLLLGSPDHFGTSVPLLVIFLAVERLPRRRFTPVVLFVLLTWAEASDSTTIFIAGGGMAVVSGMRLWQGRGDRRYEASLFAAATLSVAAAAGIHKVIQQLGGFGAASPDMIFNGSADMPNALWITVRSYLSVFSADFFGLPLSRSYIILLHLFGAAMVTWALAITARRLFRSTQDDGGDDGDADSGDTEDSDGDRIAKLITVGVLLNIIGLMFSSQISGGDREIAAALPLGAVAAARVLGPRMVHRKHIAVLSLFAVTFGVVLASNAAVAGAPADSRAAELWLKAHGYTYGLGGYWSSHNITVESRDTVRVRPVTIGQKGIEQYDW
ncbi:MAG TPA: hypothetical protein VGS97_02430, partial [Actinocrinis sp.]|uniref:hypothetical protein n=1 Tax=Actinocrinis sp. TaxID=1920516 RepID=UPI002DDD17EA